MTSITFWLRFPVEDSTYRWSFDPGMNLIQVWDPNSVDQVVERLVSLGATNITCHTPSITEGAIETLPTGEPYEIE